MSLLTHVQGLIKIYTFQHSNTDTICSCVVNITDWYEEKNNC